MTCGPLIDWAPTPERVAQLLRARTKDSTGHELGEWTDDTRPTLDEVNGIIQLACSELAGTVGTELAAPCKQAASGAAGLLAAMLVELSYYPEQVRSDRSAYPEYKDLYDGYLENLRQCVELHGGAGAAMPFGTLLNLSPYAIRSRIASAFWTRLGPWGDLPGDYWPEPENPENWPDPMRPPTAADAGLIGDAPASGRPL